MNSRERILAALNFQQTDRLPYSMLLANFFLESLDKQGHSKDYYDAADYIGCDIIKRHVPAVVPEYKNVEVRTEKHGEDIHNIFITPYGELRQIRYFHDGTQTVRKKFIENVEDIKKYIYLANNTFYRKNFERFYEEDKRIGDRGIASASAPMTPLLECVQMLMGLETTTYTMFDDEDLMQELFDAMHQRNLRCYELLSDLDCEAFIAYEDTSTTLINKCWMSEIVNVQLNEYAEILHGNGKRYIVHMCGKLKGFQTEIRELTCDGFDSVCPPTTGDIHLWEAKKNSPDKIFIGGLEPPMLATAPVEKLLSETGNIINHIAGEKGIILSSGDSVAYGTPIDNLKAIADFIKFLGEDSLKGGIEQKHIQMFLNKNKEKM